MRQIKEERIENGFAHPALEREELIAAHIPLIKLHVSRLATQLFSAKGVDQLVDAGVIGLIQAAESYNESGEPDFKVHADRCIRAAISERIHALNGTDCPTPIARKSTKSSEKLRPKLKYGARDLELALALGIDVERLASFELIAQIAGLSVGGFSAVPRACRQREADEKLICYDPDPQSNGPSCLVKGERILGILTQAVNALPSSERLVISLHYFEELTMKEIAMVLRLAEWRILQLHTKAVLRLRTSLRSHIGPHEQIRKGGGEMPVIRDAGPLRNIQKLGVVIERLPSAMDEGKLQQRLRAQVERRLRQAGIEVLPKREAINNGLPYLYVNVNILKTEIGLYVFTTRICLKQTMLLPPEPLLALYASTWEIGGVGTVGVGNLPTMLESIREQLDQFCDDHVAEGVKFNSDDHLETSLAGRYRVSGWIKQLADNFSLFDK